MKLREISGNIERCVANEHTFGHTKASAGFRIDLEGPERAPERAEEILQEMLERAGVRVLVAIQSTRAAEREGTAEKRPRAEVA